MTIEELLRKWPQLEFITDRRPMNYIYFNNRGIKQNIWGTLSNELVYKNVIYGSYIRNTTNLNIENFILTVDLLHDDLYNLIKES